MPWEEAGEVKYSEPILYVGGKTEKATQGLEKTSCSEKILPFQLRQPLRPRARLANW